MKSIYALILLLVVFVFSTCTTPAPVPSNTTGKAIPKNIILLIGDGMGLTQVSTAFIYNDKTIQFSTFLSILAFIKINLPAIK